MLHVIGTRNTNVARLPNPTGMGRRGATHATRTTRRNEPATIPRTDTTRTQMHVVVMSRDKQRHIEHRHLALVAKPRTRPRIPRVVDRPRPDDN